jgi:hypothetical protein
VFRNVFLRSQDWIAQSAFRDQLNFRCVDKTGELSRYREATKRVLELQRTKPKRVDAQQALALQT